MNDDLGKMVLNPDVVVRSRGVMEKCSMCIQMTQKTILDAKLDAREIKDGEFQTACSSACDTGAIVFGDVNDEESNVLKLKKELYLSVANFKQRVVLFWHFRKKCLGFVNQWKASLKWVAFFLRLKEVRFHFPYF